MFKFSFFQLSRWKNFLSVLENFVSVTKLLLPQFSCRPMFLFEEGKLKCSSNFSTLLFCFFFKSLKILATYVFCTFTNQRRLSNRAWQTNSYQLIRESSTISKENVSFLQCWNRMPLKRSASFPFIFVCTKNMDR